MNKLTTKKQMQMKTWWASLAQEVNWGQRSRLINFVRQRPVGSVFLIIF